MGPGYGGYGGYGACAQAGALESIGLTAEQRQQVAAIMDETIARRIALMEDMHELRSQAVGSGNADYAAMAAVRERMFALAQERRTRVDAVLTPEQRERLHGGWGPGRGFGPGR
jgi:Spy/CpxP family protein refolding chaperone